MPQVILQNGTPLGFIDDREEVRQWLDGPSFFRQPRKVRVASSSHLHAINGSSDRPFKQIGEGVFRITHSPFAIITYMSVGKEKKIALVPQRNVLAVAQTPSS